MGWPAFLLLVFFSYRYVPRRLAQLGAPPRPEPDEPAPIRPSPIGLKQRGQLRRRHRARQVEALAVPARASRR